MSQTLQQNKEFLHLLLNTTKDQAVALLFTITKSQLDLLTEIVFNLLQLPLPLKARRIVKKSQKVLEAISRKHTSQSRKQSLIRKHYRHILYLLWAVKDQLETLQ